MKIIESLQEFVLDICMLDELPSVKSGKIINHINTPVQKKTTGIFIPRSHDTLFWCFYIILEGKDAYYMTGNHKFQIEKNKKMNA